MIKKSIPSFITVLNLVCGVMAIGIANPLWSIALILTGAFLDLFDGLFARLLNVESELGKQLDSLADLITFGIAPAFLFFKISNPQNSNFFLFGMAFLAMGGAIRLARYNVKQTDEKYFRGLPIPSSGLLVCGIVMGIYFENAILFPIVDDLFLYSIICVLIGGLNLSGLKMFSFKTFNNSRTQIYFGILIIAGLSILFINWHMLLVSVFVLYIFLALLDNVLNKKIMI